MFPFSFFAGPAALWGLLAQSTAIAWESQMVIAMRMLGMGGMWAIHPQETTRMVSEKASAFTLAAVAGARAAARGERPDEVAQKMMRPIRRKTRANSRRLAKCGPNHPSRRR